MKKYIVESNKLIAQDITSLRLRPEKINDSVKFNPGQYAAISFRKNGVHSPFRSFSIANSALQNEILEFGIKTGGDYTKSISKLAPGDLVEILGPYGNFTSEASGASEIVFFAGGIGITPFVSYIRTAAARGWPQKITLLYSVRTFVDAAYINELADLQKQTENFELKLFLTKEDSTRYNNPIITSGQITGDKIDQIFENNFADKKFFICGPKPFMAAMRVNLLQRMVPARNILTEEFSASGNQASVGGSPDFKVARYALAAAIALGFWVALADSSSYASKINATLQQRTINTSPSSVPANVNSSSNSNSSTSSASPSTNGGSSTSPSSSVGSTSSSQPSYQYNTTPTTQVS